MNDSPSSNGRLSHRLLNIAGDLADIAANPPNEMDSKAMARLSSQLIALSGQVAIGERIDPSRIPDEPRAGLDDLWRAAFERTECAFVPELPRAVLEEFARLCGASQPPGPCPNCAQEFQRGKEACAREAAELASRLAQPPSACHLHPEATLGCRKCIELDVAGWQLGVNERCPTCRSPKPHRHPTGDFGEPTRSCNDPWHSPTKPATPMPCTCLSFQCDQMQGDELAVDRYCRKEAPPGYTTPAAMRERLSPERRAMADEGALRVRADFGIADETSGATCPHGKPVDDDEHQCQKCGPVVSGETDAPHVELRYTPVGVPPHQALQYDKSPHSDQDLCYRVTVELVSVGDDPCIYAGQEHCKALDLDANDKCRACGKQC